MSHKSLLETALSLDTTLTFCINSSIVVSEPRCRHCSRVTKLLKRPRSIATPSIWKSSKTVYRGTI